MRHSIACLAAACATLIALPAAAQIGIGSQPYIQIDSGASWFNTNVKGFTDKFDTGWEIDGKAGTHITDNFRTELEVGYEKANTSQPGVSGDVSNLNLMLNGIVDVSRAGPITPYLGAGLGAARINADIAAPPARIDDSAWTFAWQAMTGLDWHINDRAAINVGYRYLDASSKAIAGFKTDHNSNLISAGLRLTY